MILPTVSRVGTVGDSALGEGVPEGLMGLPGGSIPSDKSTFEISDVYSDKSRGRLIQNTA